MHAAANLCTLVMLRVGLCSLLVSLLATTQARAEGEISAKRTIGWKCGDGYSYPFASAVEACRANGPYPLEQQGANVLCPNGKYNVFTMHSDIAFQASPNPLAVIFRLVGYYTKTGDGDCFLGNPFDYFNAYTAGGLPSYRCPPNSTAQAGAPDRCVCWRGFTPILRSDGTQQCVLTVIQDLTRLPQRCEAKLQVGNPVAPLTGTKRQSVDTGLRIAGMPMLLQYDSTPGGPRNLHPVEVNRPGF